MAQYNRFSPYKNTTQQSWYLDQYDPIQIPVADDDDTYIIPQKYHQRPWMLAKDLYGNERMYYVFAITNMDLIKDPMYDFKAGMEIRIPSNATIQRIMGGR